MKRTPLKRKTPLQQGPRTVRHRTARRVDDKEFLPSVKYEAARRAHFTCKFPGCERAIQCYHHILMRSQGGKGSVDNCMPLCHRHHQHIHSNPEESYEQGWLRHAPSRG